MPYIVCDVQSGLSLSQKEQLADEITCITHEQIGSPIPYIHVAIRETPSAQFVEGGKRNRVYGKPSKAD
jgi:phenylpyruvate tautomerase PptA (4-oxalocrotonate tautomerase family)